MRSCTRCRAARLSFRRAEIADAPLFPLPRHDIDVARHFESKQTIKKLLDLMAFLKLNRLHFHLTDDEGGASRSRACRS